VWGLGSPHHLGVELISLQTGAKFIHVPYRREGPMIPALQQSEIDFWIFTPIQVLSNRVRRGHWRPLAIAGPAGMAADIVTHLNSSIRKKLQSEDALNRGERSAET
jgi:tripartite-type tricarboxylate transporter receptor subunit TctC